MYNLLIYGRAIYDTLKKPDKARYYLNVGEKRCGPVRDTLEEKIWSTMDRESMEKMKKRLNEGKPIKDFLRDR